MTKKPSNPKPLTYRELWQWYEKTKLFMLSANTNKPNLIPEQCKCGEYYKRLPNTPNICPQCIERKLTT